MWNTGLLFHISYSTFFYNTLQLATSIFKWWSWCEWIFCLFPSFFLSWFHNMNTALRYYKVSGHCHQLAFNKVHSIETIPFPVHIWSSRNSLTWLGLITKANLNHCVLLWKRDDGWCLKSVHPKSNILSSQRFRNYMDTTTLVRKIRILRFSAATSIIYTMLIPSIDFTLLHYIPVNSIVPFALDADKLYYTGTFF